MKNIVYLIIIILISTSVTSCIEKGETVEFEIINKCKNPVLIIEFSKYNSGRDTNLIQINEKVSNVIGDGTGGTPHIPLHRVDTLIIIKNDTNFITYTFELLGKNPFKLEYYELVETSSSKWGTYSRYEYNILNEDFNIK